MKLIYVASPYAGDVERNIAYAKEACRTVMERGHAFFAPHLLYPAILKDDIAAERQHGIDMGLAVLARCDELWAFGGRVSPGMEMEIREAVRLGIPVQYINTEEEKSMMLQEFEALTGFYPTIDLYAAIEEAYSDYQGDKADFCRAYRKNEGGIAEAIRQRANMLQLTAATSAEKKVSELEKKIKDLRSRLDHELEWKIHEDSRNVPQADYEKLAECAAKGNGGVRFMSDEEAIGWLYSEYGFARERIAIIHKVDVEEVNRHGQVRKTGEKWDRRPVYNTKDRHYIRFDVAGWHYEVWNGQLRSFCC